MGSSVVKGLKKFGLCRSIDTSTRIKGRIVTRWHQELSPPCSHELGASALEREAERDRDGVEQELNNMDE